MIQLEENPNITPSSQPLPSNLHLHDLPNSSNKTPTENLPHANFLLHKKLPNNEKIVLRPQHNPQSLSSLDNLEDILVIQSYQPSDRIPVPCTQPHFFTLKGGAHDDLPHINHEATTRPETLSSLGSLVIADNNEVRREETASAEIVVQTESRQQQGSTEEEIKKIASKRVLIQFLSNLVALGAYIMGYLFITDQIPIQVPFAYFTVVTSFYILSLVRDTRACQSSDVMTFLTSLGNAISLLIFGIGALVKIRGSNVLLTPFTTPGFIFLAAFFVKNSLIIPRKSRLFLILPKAMVWVELLLIGLRVDGVSIPWNTVFIPIFFTLIMLAFCAVLVALGSMFSLYILVKEEGISLKVISGLMWYILNSLFVAAWLVLLTQIINKLDGQDNSTEWALEASIIHSAVVLGYTFVFWKPLCSFQEFEMQELATEEENDSNKRAEVAFKISKDTKTKLLMISPTFFKYFKGRGSNKKGETERVTTDGAQSQKEGDIENQIPGGTLQRKETEHLVCAVCCDNVPNAVVMNCGHGGVCYECALESWKKTDDCVLCRQKIDKVLKIVHLKGSKVIEVVESAKKVVKKEEV